MAGVIVKFDKLHHRFAAPLVVPVSGDIMASRWAYEALAIEQFLNNDYQAPLAELEKLESNVTYEMQFLVPAMIQEIGAAIESWNSRKNGEELYRRLTTIRAAFASITFTGPYPGLDRFESDRFDEETGEEAIRWLQKYRSALNEQREMLSREKDRMVDSLISVAGGPGSYLNLKRSSYNEQLAQLVLNRTSLYKLVMEEGFLVRKMDPVFAPPVKRNGRAQFLASVKQVGTLSIPTFTFNLTVIWVMTLILYLTLYFSVLRKILEYFGRIKRMRRTALK
jgi:hypothetical protein